MQRAALRLSLMLIAALSIQPFNHAQNNSPDTESTLRSVVNELFAAYAREDIDGYMKLWSPKSPDLDARRKELQQLFTANDKIEVKNLLMIKVKVDSEKASVRVAVDVSALVVKTGKPAQGFGPMNRAFEFIKEEDRWKVWREAAAEENLSAALVSAKTESERASLLAAEKDLMTVKLRKALIAQAEQLRTQGSYTQALSVFDLTYRIAEQIGDKSGVASALRGIGGVKYNQADYKAALEYYQKSLSLSEAAGDQQLTANLLRGIGSIHYLQGNYVRSLEYYEKSRKLNEALENKRGIAQLQTDIGSLHYMWGNPSLALDYYRKGLELSESVGDNNLTSSALKSIGFVHSVEGNYPLALEYYQKSLTLSEKLGNKLLTADTLSKIGSVNYSQGNYGVALAYYDKSLRLREALGDKAGIATALTGIGNVHFMQRSTGLALEYFQRSLTLGQEVGNRRPIAHTLMSIGIAYRDRRNFGLALEHFQKSLKLSEELGDRLLISYALYQIGFAHQVQRHYDLALEHYRKSLTLKESLNERRGIAETLNDIATVQYEQGNYPSALETAARAVAIAREIGFRETLWEAPTTAGRAHRMLGQLEKSRYAFEEAIAAIEDFRTQVGGGEQQLQQFFENKVSPYHDMVELLTAQNNHRDALVYAERAKSRVLLDVLQASSKSVTKDMTAQEQQQERRLRSELVSVNSEVSRERQRPQLDQTRLVGLNARLEKARFDYEAFQTTLYAAHPQLRVQRGEAKTLTLEDARGLLTDQDALLEYVVTDKKTYLFVLTTEAGATSHAPKLKSYTLPITRNDLTEQVTAFRQQLARRDLTFRATANKLHELLIGAVRAELQGKRTIVIVPDGVLWELPFQALTDTNGHYLIQDHAISYAPSLTVLREMTRLRKQRQAGNAEVNFLAIGNPELRNETAERVSLVHRDEKLEPLPEAEKEVTILGQLYGPRSAIYTGADAREDRFKQEAGRFNVLHLATHGILNDASPMYSQIVLAQSDTGEDGLLEAWEIMKLHLNADMVVLSACESGLGRVGVGEGMIGLTWALFVAGSPTSVVSQWKVESSSTAQLMVEFHRNLQPKTPKLKLSKAQALQKAALTVLGNKSFRHPFYWAGFILVGDGS
jgi:CHAT domain-containing protein